MLSIFTTFCLGGMSAFGPGFIGIMNNMGVSVANTVGSTAGTKYTWPPSPRLDFTEAVM